MSEENISYNIKKHEAVASTATYPCFIFERDSNTTTNF